MWLPEGWWIITEKSTDGTRFTAGAKGLPEIESSAKFRSEYIRKTYLEVFL